MKVRVTRLTSTLSRVFLKVKDIPPQMMRVLTCVSFSPGLSSMDNKADTPCQACSR